MTKRILFAICILAVGMGRLIGQSARPLIGAGPRAGRQYLAAWAMEVRNPQAPGPRKPGAVSAQGPGKDFLAVFDVTPGAEPFGKLVAMLPAGAATTAHHTQYAMPPDGMLYANDWLGDQTYVFDLRQPERPRLVRQFGDVGGYGYPHSFAYLPNGDTLATFQYSGGFNHAPGGLVEFAPDGHVVRSGAAAAAGFPDVRPYSLAVIPQLDRVVTSSADMMSAQVSHVAQVWRLSDLKLLKTMAMPGTGAAATDSSEPRVLSDGRTVVVPTFHCGLYRVRDLAGTDPSLEMVYDAGYRMCAVPVVVGKYLVATMQSGHAIASLDLSDPGHPREVSRILLGPEDLPHWISAEAGSGWLAITGYGTLRTKILFARIDLGTGALRLEPESIDFNRAWPDGWVGSAIPHGVVFFP